jgi:hypothetical protein
MKLTYYDRITEEKTVFEGDPIDIHPYDMAELLESHSELFTLPVQIVVVDGKLYNQTVEIPAVTTRYA